MATDPDEMQAAAQQTDAPPDPQTLLIEIDNALRGGTDATEIRKMVRRAAGALAQERDTAATVLERHRLMQADGRGVQAIYPRSPGEAWEYARSLCTVGHVPSAYREGGNKNGAPVVGLVALGIMKAMEVGLPPQTGLANIMPVNDRFTVWGDGAQALVQQAGVLASYGREWIGAPEGFDYRTEPLSKDWPPTFGCHVWFGRKGVEGLFEHTYTVADALRANLWMNGNKKPWITDPLRMLFNRARAFALRDGFADCLLGLTIREEYDDYTDAPPAAGRARVDASHRLGGFGDEAKAIAHDSGGNGVPVPEFGAQKTEVNL
jgi:hypothetical protein